MILLDVQCMHWYPMIMPMTWVFGIISNDIWIRKQTINNFTPYAAYSFLHSSHHWNNHGSVKEVVTFQVLFPGEPRLQIQLFPLSLLDLTDWSEFHGIYTAFESKYIAIEVSNINPTIYSIISCCVSQLLSIDVSSDVSIHAYNLSVYFIWILSIHRTFVSQINNMLLKNGSINHHKGPLQQKKTSVTCVNLPARPKDLDHRRYRRTFGQQFCEHVHVHVDRILYKYSPNHSQSI